MAKHATVLDRQVFELSREIEFFSEKELTMQIGHAKNWWRIGLLKELIDNALDACEVAEIRPDITVEDTGDHFSVTDNGLGMKTATIKKSLDYLVRVSDKQFYVSPTRGQMGNALKTVWAAPFVVFGEGEVTIESQGKRHLIKTSLDRIAQKPKMDYSVCPGPVKNGTTVSVRWPDSSCLQDDENADSYNEPPMTAEDLVAAYAAFNPHATFHLKDKTYAGAKADWAKWRADNPTSAHWYNEDQLRDLIAAYVSNGAKSKTVREFVSEFRGLSGSQKQKAALDGFSGVALRDLVHDNDIDMDAVRKVLAAMKLHSKPVPAYHLGVIGEEHLRGWAEAHVGIMAESFKYAKRQGVDSKNGGELPYVIEVAFAVKTDTEQTRSIVTGLNWSPTLGVPADEISEAIQQARLDRHDPVILIIHMVKPRFDFVDRGKTRLAL